MKTMRALLCAFGLLLASHVVYADDPCSIDPAMKDVVEADSVQQFSSAYQTFLQTNLGQQWANSSSGGLSIGIPIDDVPVSLKGDTANSNSGSWSSSLTHSEQGNVQQAVVSRVRRSVASNVLWKAYMHCLDVHALANVSVELTAEGEDAAVLNVTYTTQAQDIPVPTILDVEITGGKLFDESWPGMKLSHNFNQQIVRTKGDTLVVTVNTSLRSDTAELPAIPVVDIAAITPPECDPCPPAPMPPFPLPFTPYYPGGWPSSPSNHSNPMDGAVCFGRYYEGWKFRLALEHLSADDRSDGPLDIRRKYLMARCTALYEQARQYAQVVPTVGQSTAQFAQEQAAVQNDINGNLNRAKQDMATLIGQAKTNKDVSMYADQPPLLSPLQLFCKYPQMRYIDDPRHTTQPAAGQDCTGVSSWPAQGIDAQTEGQAIGGSLAE